MPPSVLWPVLPGTFKGSHAGHVKDRQLLKFKRASGNQDNRGKEPGKRSRSHFSQCPPPTRAARSPLQNGGDRIPMPDPAPLEHSSGVPPPLGSLGPPTGLRFLPAQEARAPAHCSVCPRVLRPCWPPGRGLGPPSGPFQLFTQDDHPEQHSPQPKALLPADATQAEA